MKRATGSRLTIRRLDDGERCPFLLGENGLPNWYPTLFATSQLRNASATSSTIRAALDVVDYVMRWAEIERIDLEHRFRGAQYLNGLEILSLANFLKLSRRADESEPPIITGAKIVSLERARAATPKPRKSVSKQVVYQRLSYALMYLDWLAKHLLGAAVAVNPDAALHIRRMTHLLGKERPKSGRKSRVNGRRALTGAEQKEIEEVIRIGGPSNPFPSAWQKRNLLIVELYKLGIRAGELLAIKIDDIDLDGQALLIPRRHNDPSDPRPTAPSAKTYDRRIPISSALRDLIESYIINTRSAFRRAHRHDFLVVAQGNTNRAGLPLSGSGLKKVVANIREASKIENLSGHIWRHDAATRQIRLLVAQGKRPEEQTKILSYLFGWSETGDTVSTYTESYVEEEARKASLLLQRIERGTSSGNT